MKMIVVSMGILLSSCGGDNSLFDPSQRFSAQVPPPSIQAGIMPNYYSRSFYSKKLRKKIEQIIPSKDLVPVSPSDEDRAERIYKNQEEIKSISEASKALDKIRQRMVNPPNSDN